MIPALAINGLVSERDRRVVRCHTRARITFFPVEADPVFRGRSTEKITVELGHGDTSRIAVRKMSWAKRIGPASGSWSATFRAIDPKVDPFALGSVLPGDWAKLEVVRNGEVFPICHGRVDTIMRDRRSAGGATVTHWQVSGRDHAALFEVPITYSNIYAHTLREVTIGLMTERVNFVPGGSPDELFDLLIRATFREGSNSSPALVPWSMWADDATGEEKSFLEFLDIKTAPCPGAYYNEVQLWAKAGQSLWQALQFWCFPLLCEMVADASDRAHTKGDGSAIVKATIRPRPYINLDDGTDSPWFGLQTWAIPSWLPVSDSIGRHDAERFNIVQLLADVGWEGSSSEQTVTNPPRYYRESIRRHGLRIMQENTPFLSPLASKKGSAGIEPLSRPTSALATRSEDLDLGEAADLGRWGAFREEEQRRLAEWHAPNPYFLSGTVELPLPLPEVRVGHRLEIDETGAEDDRTTYYVEGVAHEFTASTGPRDVPRATTSLTLTRGLRGAPGAQVDVVRAAAKGFEALP